ncbi:MAG: 50S ribosomal protein L11 methyltransferase [Phyllobacteriaceae bacterium]|nr:50S ribosomal protein L11 methyltransferase [Phyllobacteriaceae bacterium]
MPQLRLHCAAPRAEAERLYAVVEALFDEDAFPVSIIEIDEKADIHEVSVYLDDEPTADEAARRLNEAVSGHAFAREIIPETDWVAHVLEGLTPVEAGRFFVHGSHDRDKPARGRIPIEIEAGLAFGTGHHGTTAGCLDMLTRLIAAGKPRRALDLGTGSGVLAIAIAKLAKVKVLATDIDPVATRVADANARLNEAAQFVCAATATGLDSPVFAQAGKFDLIVANILARPLMRLAPKMARIAAPGGALVLSGILVSQRRQVIAAYAGQSSRHVATTEREGWVTILLRR